MELDISGRLWVWTGVCCEVHMDTESYEWSESFGGPLLQHGRGYSLVPRHLLLGEGTSPGNKAMGKI